MLTIILRTVTLYVLVVFSMRVMGKRRIGDMQPSDLVVTLLISEIAAIPIQDPSNPLLIAIISVLVLVVLEIIMSVLSMKSVFINALTNGNSVMVIKDGRIDQRNMKKLRITVQDLVELLRMQGIFDISEVEYAVLESNGSLSVMQKSKFQPARIGDVRKEPPKCRYPSLVISDGKVLRQGLEVIGKTKSDVYDILNSKRISKENVFIMTLDAKGNTVIIEKEGIK